LRGKELLKHSFWKSGEKFENKGFVFSLFCKRVKRVREEGVLRVEQGEAQRWRGDGEAVGKGERLRFI
jgi:hypothetical protein